MNAPTIVRGVVATAYRIPWNMDYECAVIALLLNAGVSNRGESGGVLTNGELAELGDAMQHGVSIETFAGWIIDRASEEETRRRRNEWLADAVSA